jgi:hypothetical protein
MHATCICSTVHRNRRNNNSRRHHRPGGNLKNAGSTVMMIATLRSPEVVLRQDCPIAWPIDDAIVPTDPAQEQLEWIRSRYHQTLFLPEVSRLIQYNSQTVQGLLSFILAVVATRTARTTSPGPTTHVTPPSSVHIHIDLHP